MFKNLMKSLPLIGLLSLTSIILVEASQGPKLKVNFGVNLPALSFKLPSMSLPKMKITAVIARSNPRPMKIQLPAISLHAKSLEDTLGSEGAGGGSEYNNGYSYQGGNNNGGWSNNANNVDEGKPYETGYATENEEEFVDPNEDNYEEDQSETNDQTRINQDQPSDIPSQAVNYTANKSQLQSTDGNTYQGNKGFYEVKSPSINQMNGQKNFLYGNPITDGERNQPISSHLNHQMIPNQNSHQHMNYGLSKFNQNNAQSQSIGHRNPINQHYGGHNVGSADSPYIVKLPHNFQLPQLNLQENRYNGQQLDGNDNDNYIHQLPYLKRIIVNNEPFQLANPVILQSNGYRSHSSNNQPDFSKRSMISPNYYRYAIVA